MEKFLPVGVQDFAKMILGNFLYVDKTEYIYEMARPLQGFYFLARPRRFGKSLLVSTMEQLFKGKKELFKGLWIEHTDWQWKNYPVIKIDFTQINNRTPHDLNESLLNHLIDLSELHGIEQPFRSLPDCFVRLITKLSAKEGESVVVLIDEYDKPIIDHLGKGGDHLDIAKRNRDILKQLFGVLKGGDVSAALRFLFITGISKFSRVSIFSDLNNLDDISGQKDYAGILGYSEKELLHFFADRIRNTAKELKMDRADLLDDIRRWYDGYRFTAANKRVYNPFSVIKFMKTKEFNNYWFETGTPSFLAGLIRESRYPVADIETLKLPPELFSEYDLDRLRLEPLLFQTGYITIKDYDKTLYRMDYPNQEVKLSFLSFLVDEFARPEDVNLAGVYKFLNIYLNQGEIDEFIQAAQSILASIPYAQSAGLGEAFYHTAFYLMLSASGVSVQTEILTGRGRIDIAVEFADKVYVIELKCNYSADKAIGQILEKKYYERYLGAKKDIFLMGINFDTEKRGINDWRWGKLAEFIVPDQG